MEKELEYFTLATVGQNGSVLKFKMTVISVWISIWVQSLVTDSTDLDSVQTGRELNWADLLKQQTRYPLDMYNVMQSLKPVTWIKDSVQNPLKFSLVDWHLKKAVACNDGKA